MLFKAFEAKVTGLVFSWKLNSGLADEGTEGGEELAGQVTERAVTWTGFLAIAVTALIGFIVNEWYWVVAIVFLAITFFLFLFEISYGWRSATWTLVKRLLRGW